ncbi:MAG: response regulator transcription factor [Tepidisphaeraceae bacterium]
MRVLVVEDEPRMREALEAGLRQHGFAVDGTGFGEEGEALAAQEAGRYDLILLDIMLPDVDGTDVCRELRRRGVTTPILMLTALGATDEKVDGLDAGADDYLTKPFEFAELLSRIRAILRRGQATESRTLRFEDLELDLGTRQGRRGDRRFELSNKEFMLLEVLLRNPERVLTRQQIGEKVWDMNFDPASNVVDVYVAMLRKHVDRGFTKRLIRTVKGAGYRLSGRGNDGD